MFENIMNFLKKFSKKSNTNSSSKDTAKERLHLVLMQDRANVSADFLDLMRQEIIDVIKKYIEVDESAIDVRLTNKENEDGTNGAPALYANIPIINIKEEARQEEGKIAKAKKETEQNSNTKSSNSEEDKNEKIKMKDTSKLDNKENQKNNNSSEEKKEEIKADSKEEKKSDNSNKE